MSVFKCEVCGNEYYYRQSLRRHIFTVHPQQLNDIMPPRKNNKPFSYRCLLCDKNFASKSSLKRHKRVIHGEMQQKRLKCMLCVFETVSKKCWLDHLRSTHEINVKYEDLQFSTELEFLNWKEEVERTTHSKFVKARGPRVAGDCSRRYYLCHRSGRFISHGKGKRRLKSSGSVKMNGKCPAEMKVLCKAGMYRVHFLSTHVGHNLSDQVIGNTNCKPPDVNVESKTSQSLSDVNSKSKKPESVVDKKQRIISVFSDIVNGLTGSEVQLAERMVISLKENLHAVRAQNSRSSLLRSPERIQKRKIMPQRKILFTTRTKSTCHVPSSINHVEEDDVTLRSLLDDGPNSIHNVTVEEDSVTSWNQELHHVTTGPFIVAVEQDDDTPWQQELQHYTSGPVSVAMEQEDDMPWHQELQHCTPGLDTNQCVAIEHSYAIPGHLVKQRSTPIWAVLP